MEGIKAAPGPTSLGQFAIARQPDDALPNHFHAQFLNEVLQTTIDDDSIDKCFDLLHNQREQRLASASIHANRQVVPKDLSVRIAVAHMSFIEEEKQYEDDDMHAIEEDDQHENRELASVAYIQKMVEVAELKGFKVMVTCTEGGEHKLRQMLSGAESLQKHLLISPIPKSGCETFVEDSGRFDIEGKLSFPAVIMDEAERSKHFFNVYCARALRLYPNDREQVLKEISRIKQSPNTYFHKKQLENVFPDIGFPCFHTVAEYANANGPLARGISLGNLRREDYTHQEGGNTLTGVRKDGTPFGLVGRDSAEFSRSLLADALGKEIDDDVLKCYLGADLGVDPKEVFLIEQPRDFHLDIFMTLMTPGEIVINDPIMAAEKGAEWSRKFAAHESDPAEIELDIEEMHAEAADQKPFIDRAVEDLKNAGLEIHTLPLVFDMPAFGKMNFANVEGGTGPDDRPFIVSNGGPKFAEEFIAAQYQKKFGAECFFVDADASAVSLENNGGVGCRVLIQAQK